LPRNRRKANKIAALVAGGSDAPDLAITIVTSSAKTARNPMVFLLVWLKAALMNNISINILWS